MISTLGFSAFRLVKKFNQQTIVGQLVEYVRVRVALVGAHDGGVVS